VNCQSTNQKKLLRLYREEGLKLRRCGGQKRALGTRVPIALPQGPNQRWSLDFVSVAFTVGVSVFCAFWTTARANGGR
jgi:putative transposase